MGRRQLHKIKIIAATNEPNFAIELVDLGSIIPL
jgi:hypothetical protein